MPLAAMLIVSMSVITVVGQTTPVVSISPAITEANPGEYFTVDINIADVQGLFGWEVMISYSVSITPYTIVEYEGVGGMKWLAEMMGIDTTFNYAKHPGYILVSCLFTEQFWIDGSFPLATVTMFVLDPVKTSIHFDYVRLVDVNGNMKPYTSQDGLLYTTQPVSAFDISPAFHIHFLSPPHRHVGETITFDATASFDPDNCVPAPAGITKYEWDLGDGTTGTGMTVTKQYNTPGEYLVTLKVTDDDVPSESSTTDLMVAITGDPVIESIEYSPCNPRINDVVTFEATAGDVCGAITKWEWDFGDGISEVYYYPVGDTVTHAYVADGTYTVTLTVYDNEPVPNTDTMQIQVTVYKYYEADLIMKRVDPSRRPRLDTVTFVGRVKNLDLSNYDLYVKVAFDIMTEVGEKISLETNVAVVAPGAESPELTVDWTPEETGRYYGTATAWYSLDGVCWNALYTGKKVKTFSLEVRP